jgi:hypothetical protein
MILSNDLLSQFAKITNDEKSIKSEKSVYGTIVENGDRTYVRLDGSELLTPVTSAVDALPGERVIVMLKNHTATVTGNISSPAVRTETVRTVSNNVAEVEEKANEITIRLEDVSGRNYIARTMFGTAGEHKKYSSSGTLTRTEEGLKLTYNSDTARNGFVIPLAFDGCLENGQKYTLSFKYRTNMTNTGTIYVLQRTTPNVNVSSGAELIPSDTEWQTFEHTFSSNSINDRISYAILIPYALSTSNWIEIKDKSIKLEKGTTATAWTPALEDGVITATNYMNLSSAGLVVGQDPADPTSGNVLISTNGVSIRNGTTILSEFKAASRTASGISSATLT